jgi:N4-gp56 family major capsid protein
MALHGYDTQTARIDKFKGRLLKRAQSVEVTSRFGRQVQMPKNNSDTYIARRWLPHGGTSGNPNTFFNNVTGDRAAAYANAHLATEGVTATPETITPVDYPVVIQQYTCLYGYTDKTYNLYEDDVPAEMIKLVGERITLVNEMVNYGVMKATTNQYYGGSGTSVATVDGGITLSMIRDMVRALQAEHCGMVTSVLKASPNYATEAVAGGYVALVSTDLEPDVRDLAGFVPAEKYASGTPMKNELGKVERVRFISTPDFPARLNAGAAVGATGLYSTTGSSIDVYQFILMGEDAWSQIAVRGLDSMDPTHLPPGRKDKSDPNGQRGYVGCAWWKAALVENDGWLACGNVGRRAL